MTIWVGKDEAEGIPVQDRKDTKPPPHWRLEPIAATERPRSLAVAADRTRAVFIQDRDTSDVWILDLRPGAIPERLTSGRDPMPYWEDTDPQLSPDGTQVAYAQGGHVWLVAAAGGPPRKLLEADAPVWVDDATLVVSVERGDASRLAVVGVADPWPRRLATGHGDLEAHGDEWGAAVSPDRTEVAYVFTPRADLNRSEIRVASLDGGTVRAVTGTPRMQDRAPAWSPDGATLAYVSERSGWWALHVVGADGSGERQLTGAAADHGEPAWHPDGDRIAVTRGVRNRIGLAVVDAASGAVTEVAAGGVHGAPQWTADGAIAATYEDHATPPQLRLVTPGDAPVPLLTPSPLAVRSAPHAAPEDVVFASRDGLEIPAMLFRPRDVSPERPVPAIVYPHGGPTDAYQDAWDGHLQYFVDKGYAWLAVNFRGSTGYGREFERANHDVWGVKDTWDCLAAADHLRTLDWVDGDRLGIFGASYGSYMSLLVGHRRPRAPLPLRVHEVRRLRHRHLLGAGRPRGRPGPRADDGPAVVEPRGLPRRLADPPGRADRGAAADRARRARRARQPAPVGGTGRRPAPRGQDLRVRDVPDGGPRTAARRTAAALLPPARALPRLVSNVTVSMDEIVQSVTRRKPSNGE